MVPGCFPKMTVGVRKFRSISEQNPCQSYFKVKGTKRDAQPRERAKPWS
jgi:hypothetical protein